MEYISCLGYGTTCAVYLARGRMPWTRVVVKEFFAQPGLPELGVAMRRNLLAEIETLMSLSHAGLARVLDCIERPRSVLMVTEFVRGQTLRETVSSRGPLPWRTACAVALAILEALELCHSVGIAHRNIRPGTVVLRGSRCVLTGYGLSGLWNFSDPRACALLLSARDQGYACPHVNSPEIARPDIWGTGVVLHYALAGRSPLFLPGAVRAQPAVPPVVSRALAGEFRTAGEMRNALKELAR